MKKILSFTLALLMIFSVPVFVSAEDQKSAWEFNTAGDLEGWSFGNAQGAVADGYLSGSSKPNASKDFQAFDPAVSVSKLNIDASVYKYIQVSMKHEMKTKDSNVIKIYFQANDSQLSEKASVSKTINKSSGGKYVDYVFDMGANAGWTGTIKALRIDPFDDDGTFSFDYVRLLKEAPAGTADSNTSATSGTTTATTTTTTTTATPEEKSPFTEVNKFTMNTFKDISTSAWYYADASTSYKLGFMKGKSEGLFDPNGNVTVAEGIALAVRINDIYNGGKGTFQQGEPWYQVYVDAAIKAKIITDGQFDDYTKAITRAEMASLLAKALPSDYYNAINKFKAIPDVKNDNTHFKDLLLLYNAGIVVGADAQFNYLPDNNIKRCEVAAIINRVAIKKNRLRKVTAEEQAEIDAAAKAAAEKAAKDEADRKARASQTAISFKFDDGQLGKFTAGNCEDGTAVKDGFLNATSKLVDGKRYDPIIYIPITDNKINIDNYRYIRIGLKWSTSADISNIKPSVFFTTVADDTWTAEKNIQADKTFGKSSSDSVVEFVIDCSKNSAWKGTLKQLRFDPYDAPGTFSIDYISIEEG